MLTMTDSAGARLTHLLTAKADGFVARIIRSSRGRLRLRLDRLRDRDQTFSHRGRVVLALDEEVAGALAVRQLDVRFTANGPRLRLKSA